MFEAMSALATVGLSTGITPGLTTAGKIVLCLAMFAGRLGPLTIAYALQRHQRPARYRFPEEPVRIG
jgi:trk system potassium uptake protein TrkH